MNKPFRSRRARSLFLEPLEDRALMAVLTVNTNEDNTTANGALSLREAIAVVNAQSSSGRSNLEKAQVTGALGSNDTIQFAPALNGQTITLGGTRLNLTKNVKITGPGASQLTINGNNASQIFFVDGRTNGSITVEISGLTLKGGNANGSGGTTTGGVDNSLRGGAVFNDSGVLTINATNLVTNRALLGGAVYNLSGTTTVQNSNVDSNFAQLNGAGLVNALGTTNIIQSTVSRNQAEGQSGANGFAGGILNGVSGGTVNVLQSTIVDNHANNPASDPNHGAGIYTVSGATTILKNTVVAGNTVVLPGSAASDIGGDTGVTVSGNNNFIGSAASGGLQNGVSGNLVRTRTLAELFYPATGAIPIYVPTDSSPLVDAGNNGEVSLTTDLRGQPRNAAWKVAGTATVDIGVVELQFLAGPYLVDLATDDYDGNFAAGDLSLREAIGLANARTNSDTVTFANGLAPIDLTIDQLTLAQNVLIDGGGDITVRRSSAVGTAEFRIFEVSSGVTADLRGLTISNGNSATDYGGGIYNDDGTLTVSQSTLSGNSASYGGGIYNDGGTLTVSQSTLSGNSVSQYSGGGIYNFVGTLTVTQSTLSGNSASYGGGIASSGTLTVSQSTLASNSAGIVGGGIYNLDKTVTVVNSTLTGNRADSNGDGNGTGGGIWTFNDGSTFTTLYNTIVAGNFVGTGTTPNDLAQKNVEAGSLNNLIGDAGSAGGLTNGTNGNKVGFAVDSVLNTTLANNGGPTQTHALVANSPAINAGNNLRATIDGQEGSTALTTDQRGTGFVRIADATVDIGAFESPAIVPGDSLIAFDPPTGRWFGTNLRTGVQKVIAQWPTNTTWRDGVVADFNGDGNSDLAARHQNGKWYVGLAQPGNVNLFGFKVFGSSTLKNFDKVQIADVNNDGKADIIGYSQAAGARWYIFKSTGAIFTPQVLKLSATVQRTDYVIADFTGDGLTDFGYRTVAKAPALSSWFVHTASTQGTFAAGKVWGKWSAIAYKDVQPADYNGDGKQDIVGRDPATGKWRIAQSTGSAFTMRDLKAWQRDASAGWKNVKVGDFNKDGKDEIIGQNKVGNWFTMRQNGTVDVISRSLVNWANADQYKSVFVADLNRDGRDELIGRRGTTGKWRIDQLNVAGTRLATLSDPLLQPTWDKSVDWLFASLGKDDGNLF